jgi:hypothetical protein
MAKKTNLEKVQCYTCRHAVLQQWDNNPVVAYCNKHGLRDTAMTFRLCKEYSLNKEVPEVKHLKRYP